MPRRLALIPARGGSKGLPGKNLAIVGGCTLIARAIRCANETGLFNAVVASTDDPAIAEEAVRAGALVPFLRPKALAGDDAPVLAAIKHALSELEREAPPFDLVALLEPTSPLRTPRIVIDVIAAAEREGSDAALSVSPVPTRYHALKQLIAAPGGEVHHFHPEGTRIVTRQQLSPTYIRNGMCYAVRRSALDSGHGILGSSARMIVVTTPVVNIDDAEDLELARRLIVDDCR